MYLKSWAVVWICLAALPSLASEPPSASQAEEAYDKGDYEQAAILFKQALERGGGGHVAYNLGNTLYQSGQRGAAMAAYLTAWADLPRDADLWANLQQTAKSLEIEAPQWGMGAPYLAYAPWISAASGAEWIVLSLVAALAAVAVFFGGRYRLVRWQWLLICISLQVVSGAFLVASYLSEHAGRDIGAVAVPVASVYNGPGREGNAKTLELPEGSAFRITGNRSGWAQILLATGQRGWIERESFSCFSCGGT